MPSAKVPLGGRGSTFEEVGSSRPSSPRTVIVMTVGCPGTTPRLLQSFGLMPPPQPLPSANDRLLTVTEIARFLFFPTSHCVNIQKFNDFGVNRTVTLVD